MRVVDLGITMEDHPTWVDPVFAATVHPDTLPYHPYTKWNAGTPHLAGDVVEYDGKFWRALMNMPRMRPSPCGDQFGDLNLVDPFPEPFNEAFRIGKVPCQWVEIPENIELLNRSTAEALAQATWLLNTLTGNRLHGVECWQEDYAVHSCEIKLRRGPVQSIQSVAVLRRCRREYTDLIFEDWCQARPNVISLCCNCSFSTVTCGCGDTVIRVRYKIGSNMPPGGPSTVMWLAAELAKASQGKACALPDRISNINRQGVSWSILDPADFLDKGRTGVNRVDQWIEAAKMQTGSATMIDPLKSDRVSGFRLPCVGGEFGDLDTSDPTPDPFTGAFNKD